MPKPRPLEETVKLMTNDINFKDLLRFNQFTEDIEFTKFAEWDFSIENGKIISDGDLTNIRYYLSCVHSKEPTKQILGEACFIVASRNSYHPVKQYIESEKWD